MWECGECNDMRCSSAKLLPEEFSNLFDLLWSPIKSFTKALTSNIILTNETWWICDDYSSICEGQHKIYSREISKHSHAIRMQALISTRPATENIFADGFYIKINDGLLFHYRRGLNGKFLPYNEPITQGRTDKEIWKWGSHLTNELAINYFTMEKCPNGSWMT